jgi:ankyrin repeat protein
LQCTTPLSDAARLSDPTALEILLSHGANMDPDALFSAISGYRGVSPNGTATMEVLIAHGADVNYVSETFGTPLYHAVRHLKESKIKLLLQHGADPGVKCFRAGITALEFAREKGRMEFYDIMHAACSLQRP